MPFEKEVAYAAEVGHPYGNYHSTFRSLTGQVLAYFFERNGWLVAHVRFPTGLKPENVTDSYFSDLNRYAGEQGFADKLRIIYGE